MYNVYMKFIRVDDDLYERLTVHAKIEERSLTSTLRRILRQALDEIDFEKDFGGMTEEEFRQARLTPQEAKELFDPARLKRKETDKWLKNKRRRLRNRVS